MNPPPPIDDLGRTRTRGQRVLLGIGSAVLFLLVGMDLLNLGTDEHGWPALWMLTVLVTGLAGVLWPARWRAARPAPAVRTALPALLSLGLTATVVLTGRQVLFGAGEILILLCLLMVAVRTCPPGWAMICGGLNAIAVAALAARGEAGYPEPGLWSMVLVLLVIPIAGAAGLGGYLRTLDHNRAVAVTRTRQAERLAMAADLHDFVAHHVTGILVQAQMARMMDAGRPDGRDGFGPVLHGIEEAATQALASMRRTVGILRDDTAAIGAGTRTAGDLAALPDLVNGFSGPTGPATELRRAPSVPDDLPPEIQTAAYRVVQEALTNIRRHAADATTVIVTVDLTHDGRALGVAVCDDGCGGVRLPAEARGGGFGLVGLTERVTALGGELRAGPRPDHGWTVHARLPTA